MPLKKQNVMSRFQKVMSLAIIMLLTSGCLMNKAKQARLACENGDCQALNLKQAGQMSANPDNLDQKDTQHLFEVLQPTEEKEGIVVKVKSRKQCRALRYTTDFYTFPKGPLFWTDIGLVGGGVATLGASLAMMDNTAVFATLLTAGAGMAIYGATDLIGHKIFSRSELTRVERGEFIDCESWIQLPMEGEVLSYFPSLTEDTRSAIPLKKEKDRFLVPEYAIGFAHLKSPHLPAVDLTVNLEQSTHDKFFMAERPAKRAWLCEAMRHLSAIQIDEDPRKWKLHFSFHEDAPPAVIDWLYSDGRTVFGTHHKYLKRCPKDTRDHLATIANEVIQENPQTYGIFQANLSGVIRTALYKPSPKPTVTDKQRPVAKAGPAKTPRKKGKGKAKQKPKATDTPERKPPYGRYRCIHNGQIAKFQIRRDGSFVLSVELENGMAYGECPNDRSCIIKGVKGSALNFTQYFNQFKIRRGQYSLTLNNKIRCDLRK